MNEGLVTQLIELRKRLIFILIGFILAFVVLFKFKNYMFDQIAKPLLEYLPKGTKLIATDVTAPFFVPLKITAIAAVFLSLPNTIFQIWQYIAPGLYKHERRLLFFIIIFAIVLFSLGILFCYYLVLPLLFNFISNIKATDIEMFTDIHKYLDLVLTLFMVFGISFQMPIAIFCLIYFNLVKATTIKKLRPYIFVGCFIIAAIVTPPDIFSQSILAISLYVLYEFGIIFTTVLYRIPK
ncbi:MAG TPA: twin-arginine translocase subunit TatC [Aquella sp.]|nr:twin-arginine translocase subunit TatC [Aquella sp.]